MALVGAIVCPLAILSIVEVKRRWHKRDAQSEYKSDSQNSWGNMLSKMHSLFSTSQTSTANDINQSRITIGGYESLIGNTPLIYLPNLSSLLNNNVKIYVKMENMNPGGTGKDRAARSMILAAEKKGELPNPLNEGVHKRGDCNNQVGSAQTKTDTCNTKNQSIDSSSIPADVQVAICVALKHTKTHGILIEGTSGSTGIALASISSSRGHGVIVVMPDDQSSQKREYLERLGCGVVVVKNCSISNPGHYVNVARRIWEWIEVERRFDDWYCNQLLAHRGVEIDGCRGVDVCPRLIKAAFMNQFENLANLTSHYSSTGPEIYDQLNGAVDAFVMSSGTGGTIVGAGGYLKDRWWLDKGKTFNQNGAPPRIVLVDPPGSSLYNKVKFGVAYTSQMSEQKLRRHRYDTLAEGIGLDRITANFGLGCIDIGWSCDGKSFRRSLDALLNEDAIQSLDTNDIHSSKVIDDAITITDQQAVFMAHYLLRHEGLFVGSSSAMNIAGALMTASSMPPGSNVVTVVCDGGQRHTARFWNQEFIEEWGLKWPENSSGINILQILGLVKD